MSMKEAFGEQDPELASRQSVVHAAVAAFEQNAWRVYGPALVEETPAPASAAMNGVELSTLSAAGQGAVDMAAISTQNTVQMPGVEDVRAA